MADGEERQQTLCPVSIQEEPAEGTKCPCAGGKGMATFPLSPVVKVCELSVPWSGQAATGTHTMSPLPCGVDTLSCLAFD